MINFNDANIVEGQTYRILSYYFICEYIDKTFTCAKFKYNIANNSNLWLKLTNYQDYSIKQPVVYQAGIRIITLDNQTIEACGRRFFNYTEALHSLSYKLENWLNDRKNNIDNYDIVLEKLQPIFDLEKIKDILE